MTIQPNQQITIPVGKYVVRNGEPTRQKRATQVTVRRTEKASRGKTRIFWIAGGYEASALI